MFVNTPGTAASEAAPDCGWDMTFPPIARHGARDGAIITEAGLALQGPQVLYQCVHAHFGKRRVLSGRFENASPHRHVRRPVCRHRIASHNQNPQMHRIEFPFVPPCQHRQVRGRRSQGIRRRSVTAAVCAMACRAVLSVQVGAFCRIRRLRRNHLHDFVLCITGHTAESGHCQQPENQTIMSHIPTDPMITRFIPKWNLLSVVLCRNLWLPESRRLPWWYL